MSQPKLKLAPPPPAHAYGARDRETQRPFRLWDAKHNQFLRWRYYASISHAHNAALIEVRWSTDERAIEVLDIRTARWLATYVLRGSTILIERPTR